MKVRSIVRPMTPPPSAVDPEADVAALARLASHTGGVLAASAVHFASLVLSSVIIARLVGVEGRGLVATAVLVPTIVAYAGELGLPTATGYLISNRQLDRAAVVGTARTLALAFSIVLVAISLGLTLALPLTNTERTLALAFAAFIPLNLMQRLHLAMLQGELRFTAFNAVRSMGAVAYVSAVATLPVLDAASTTGVVAALLVGNAVWFALGAILAPRRPLFAWDRAVARRLVGYGARAHLGSVSPLDTLRLDQLVLAVLLPAHALGLYVTAMTFLTSNRILGVSLGFVAFPVAVRTPPNQARRTLLHFAGSALALGGLVALLEIGFGRTLLNALFGSEFRDAYPALVILSLASVAMNVRGVVGDWLRGAGRPGVAALGEAVSLAVLLPAFVLLWNGVETGVAAGVLVASTVALAATAFLIRTSIEKS